MSGVGVPPRKAGSLRPELGIAYIVATPLCGVHYYDEAGGGTQTVFRFRRIQYAQYVNPRIIMGML